MLCGENFLLSFNRFCSTRKNEKTLLLKLFSLVTVLRVSRFSSAIAFMQLDIFMRSVVGNSFEILSLYINIKYLRQYFFSLSIISPLRPLERM